MSYIVDQSKDNLKFLAYSNKVMTEELGIQLRGTQKNHLLFCVWFISKKTWKGPEKRSS